MFRLTATTLRATTVAIPILLATAIAIPSLLATSLAVPASAQQITVGIGFDNFHQQLAPYGTWSNHSQWGEVWHPRADRDFRPYYNGHWEDTREYGWLWVSDDNWGDVPYHYGRWLFDPREGWLWVPGYVWAPSWVVWREGGGNIGWFPMPPGDNYYGDGPYRDNFSNQYGYSDWYGPSFGNDQFMSLWIFVGNDHFRDRNFRNYAVPQRNYSSFFSQTINTTNYITINNYVVNRSVDRDRLQRATNQRFEPVAARSVIGPKTIVTQAREGRQVEQRERQRRPIPASIDRSDQRGRDNPNTNAQQQNRNQPAPAVERSNDRGTGPNGRTQANPQTERGAAGPEANTPRRNERERANIAPAEQRGRNADRDPAVTNTPPSNGDAARQGQAETRGARDQKDNVVVQDSRRPARVQESAPDADGQGKARADQTRANKQDDTKNADDRDKADDKKTRPDRGRN
jgi:hypothetical protein